MTCATRFSGDLPLSHSARTISRFRKSLHSLMSITIFTSYYTPRTQNEYWVPEYTKFDFYFVYFHVMRKHVYDGSEQQRRKLDCVSSSSLLFNTYKVHIMTICLYVCSFDLLLTWSETVITFLRDKIDLFIQASLIKNCYKSI